MLFWIIVSALTAAAAALVMLPLLRAGKLSASPAAGHDVSVYRDQLDELERDRASGLITSGEAELARAEIARRLFAATDAANKASASAGSPLLRRLGFALIFLCLPAVGLGFYLRTGSPEMPDQPLAARLANPGDDMNVLLARAENHLATNPGDGAGWDLLAPIYMRAGRFDDAANAYARALDILGATPDRLGGYAEAQVALSGGLVTTEAQEALQKALVLDPKDARAQFYLALGLEQEGKREAALTAFEQLAAEAPKDAPWLGAVNDHVTSLRSGTAQAAAPEETAKAPGNPTADDVAAASGMEAGDRQQMIRGMVDSLAARLKDDPKNFEGWARLIRSYVVLDQRDKAAEALGTGLKTFPADGAEGQQLLALAQELGLSAPQAAPAEGEGK
ncbi:cytochrome c-type biogenesis protein CcmH [Rhizobium sp. RU20A]|uniref:c-type cytochrome biogenesis protein CcmI n=1 Tax=Rhizobium sp. RU20A TaxID=1907412 RepID=UPI00095642C7|nr:c-type cytochrome biogenesis protein CcmI [Rhizobium sp. RU20A]SIR15450.1 cytochrome c-type biogenesis protein CcmH [Rhizobium sp. RU20A]